MHEEDDDKPTVVIDFASLKEDLAKEEELSDDSLKMRKKVQDLSKNL